MQFIVLNRTNSLHFKKSPVVGATGACRLVVQFDNQVAWIHGFNGVTTGIGSLASLLQFCMLHLLNFEGLTASLVHKLFSYASARAIPLQIDYD